MSAMRSFFHTREAHLVFVLSVVVIFNELLLNKLISFRYGLRGSFIVIALCLAGLAFGSALYALSRKRVPIELTLFIASLSVVSQLFYFGSLWWQLMPSLFLYALLGAVLARSYAVGGNVIRIHGFALLGSAVGAALYPLMLPRFGLNDSVLFAALAVACLAVFRLASLSKQLVASLVVLGGFFFVFQIFSGVVPCGSLHAKEFLRLVQSSVWNSYSRLDLMKARPLHRGISPRYEGDVASAIPLTVECLGGGNLSSVTYSSFLEEEEGGSSLDKEITQIAARFVGESPTVLVLGSGGGRDIVGLKRQRPSFQKLDAVELNASIVQKHAELLPRQYASIYDDSRVRLHIESIRSYLRRSDYKYNLITLPVILFDPNAGASHYGRFTESYLYTREAVSELLRDLSPNGILSVSFPSREEYTKRYAALLLASMQGGELIWFQGRDFSTLLFKPAGFNVSEENLARELSQSLGFPASFYNRDSLERLAGARNEATDDRPYFNFHGRVSQVLKVLGLLAILMSGAYVLLRRTMASHKLGMCPYSLSYFGFCGALYLGQQFYLISKLRLLMAHPGLSLLIVIPTFLLANALGCYLVGRWRIRSVGKVIGILFLLNSLLLSSQAKLIEIALGYGLFMRVFLSVVLVAPYGVLLGMPYVVGLQKLQEKPVWIPYALFVNGAWTILAAILYKLIAVSVGFHWMLVGCSLLGGMLLLLEYCHREKRSLSHYLWRVLPKSDQMV